MPVLQRHRTPFVGRVAELTRLRDLLATASQGQATAVLITGEAGVGKTRLLAETADHARASGWLVVTSTADQVMAAVPYATLGDLIGQAISHLSGDALTATLGDGVSDLARLVPTLSTSSQAQPRAPSLSPDLQRYRLLEMVTRLLGAVAATATAGLMICCDDLQWVDPSTITAIVHVIRRLHGRPVIVLATARLLELEPSHPLRLAVAALVREPHLHLVELDPFGPADVSRLLNQRTGLPVAPGVAAMIGTITAGNPFLAEEMIDHLLAQGREITDPALSLDTWEPPTSVRLLVEARLHRLGTSARQVVLTVAVLGEQVPVTALAAITETNEASVVDGLEEAARAGLLSETVTGYRCRHALIRAGLLALVSPPRQRVIRRQAVLVIEGLWADERSRPAALLADLAERADPSPAMTARAHQYALLAAERARARLAYDDAIQYYQRALALEDAQPDPALERRCGILLALGEVQRWAGHIPAARATYRQAVAVARQVNQPELLARAVLGLRVPREEEAGRVDSEQLALLDEALLRLGPAPTALRARLLATQIRASWTVDYPIEARARNQEAIAIARQVDDDQALMMALSGAPAVLWHPAGRAERLARGREIVQIAQRCQDSWYEQLGYLWQLGAAVEAADRPEIESMVAAITRLADAAPHPGYTFAASAAAALRALIAGHLAVAEDQIDRVEQAARLFDWPAGVPTTMLYPLLQLRREQGRLEEMRAPLTTAVAIRPKSLAPPVALAYCHAELNCPTEARAVIEPLLARGLEAYQSNANWLACLVMLADCCATLGERAWLTTLEPLLAPHEQQIATLYNIAACFGSVARPLGRLCGLAQRWDEAARYFEIALTVNRRLGANLWLAHTAHEYALMLLATGDPAARPRAVALLRQAQTLFSAHQSRWADHLAALLTSVTASPPARPRHRAHGPDRLSEREREVLLMVAEGHSDQAIARLLSISPNTVGRHLSRIYAKIGATNRASAVAYIARQQWLPEG